MKKLLTISSILLGLFLFTGIASASTTDLLQPASTITYNEDLTVDGTGRFNSIYIGETGVGGVTFFNGTIINIGEHDPVTFGDDVRIDGLIWGGPNKGNASDQGLKIADTLLPGLTDINDIGSSDLRWKNLYVKDVNVSGDIMWSEPKEYVMSVAGPACIAGEASFGSGEYCSLTPAAKIARWGINLPDEVKIKSFEGILYDNDGSENMTCLLNRVARDLPPSSDTLATLNTSLSSTAWKKATDNSIVGSAVSNNSYSYYVICTGNPGSNTLRASSFKIKYEKTYVD